jgi:hypothetical protein
VKEGKSRFKFDSLEHLKTATREVLLDGVGRNQPNAQGVKSENPFFHNFFISLIATT